MVSRIFCNNESPIFFCENEFVYLFLCTINVNNNIHFRWKNRRSVVRKLVKLSLLGSNVIWSLDLSVEDSPSSYSGPKYSVAVWSIGWSTFTLKRLQLTVGSHDLVIESWDKHYCYVTFWLKWQPVSLKMLLGEKSCHFVNLLSFAKGTHSSHFIISLIYLSHVIYQSTEVC